MIKGAADRVAVYIKFVGDRIDGNSCSLREGERDDALFTGRVDGASVRSVNTVLLKCTYGLDKSCTAIVVTFASFGHVRIA